MPRRPRTLLGAFACALLGVASTSCTLLEPALGPGEPDAAVTVITGDDDGGGALPPGDDGSDGGGDDAGGDSGPAPVSFALQIRPLMNRADTDPNGHGCAYCHYPGQGTMEGLMMTGLNLSTLGTLRMGGSSTGTGIINVADPVHSGLVEKLQGRYFEGARMPKSGPPYWSDDEIQLVITWMGQGALGADSD